ncbi:MAG: DUF3151 domain-containing protein [bacterium]
MTSPRPGLPDLLSAPTHLPEDLGAAELTAGQAPAAVAAAHPDSLAAWAALAEQALAEGRTVDAYAYARTGYHRGLDGLRRAGWKGNGPVPWSHQPNQGFLRSLHALGLASAALGDEAEAHRCEVFLRDSDPAAVSVLAG